MMDIRTEINEVKIVKYKESIERIIQFLRKLIILINF